MENTDIKLFGGLIGKLIFLGLILFGPKLGRFILQKFPNSITLKIIFSEDVGRGHYYFWIVSSLVLAFAVAAIVHLNLYISLFLSLSIVLFIMVQYYKRKGLDLNNDIDETTKK